MGDDGAFAISGLTSVREAGQSCLRQAHAGPRHRQRVLLHHRARNRDPGAGARSPANDARFEASGRQRNRGIELSILAEPVLGLRVITGASVIDARLRRQTNGLNEGNKVGGVPDYLVNGNVEWNLPFIPAPTLTGRIVHTGEQPANNANTLALQSWTRFDLGARYVALVSGRPVTLRASLDNVSNERYWASAFDTSRPDLLQGGPRTFKLSASIDL